MSLSAFALTTLANAKNYMGLSDTELESDGITVYCSSIDATAATAQVTATTLVLKITGGADAGTNTLTFAAAANDTIGELVTVINALDGWVANAQAHASSASTDLVIVAATGCLLIANILTLVIVDNYLLESLINQASDIVERYCAYKFISRKYYHERQTGYKASRFYVEQKPITSIESVATRRLEVMRIENSKTDNVHAYVSLTTTTSTSTTLVVNKPALMTLQVVGGGGAGTDTIDLTDTDYDTLTEVSDAINALGDGWQATITSSAYNSYPSTEFLSFGNRDVKYSSVCIEVPDPADSYDINWDEGYLYNIRSSRQQDANIITYTAGYSSVSTLPYALQNVVLKMVKVEWQGKDIKTGFKSETLDDYKYIIADTALTPGLKSELSLFARKRT